MYPKRFISNFMGFYNILWQGALPFLRRHPRLKQPFDPRHTLSGLPRADVWIQAASAGEALLALSLVRNFCPDRPVRILLTTTTAQGMEILASGLATARLSPRVRVFLAWFPPDMPRLIRDAVRQVSPKVMVLMETELWPGLLYHLISHGTRILVINGRMSRRSAPRYALTAGLWSGLAPDRILAISPRDAQRFQTIFPASDLSVMPNLKFELTDLPVPPETAHRMACLLHGPLPLTLLASIRRQEEPQVFALIQRILSGFPDQVVAVFPRHLARVPHWHRQLIRSGYRVVLRSGLKEPMPHPGILLWDVFGEQRAAMAHARAVFVGGTLADLGGQNFLEPILQGAATVVGPFRDDFAWVGDDIFQLGIVEPVGGWQPAADALVAHLKIPPDRNRIKTRALDYVAGRAGGSKLGCRAIREAMG